MKHLSTLSRRGGEIFRDLRRAARSFYAWMVRADGEPVTRAPLDAWGGPEPDIEALLRERLEERGDVRLDP